MGGQNLSSWWPGQAGQSAPRRQQQSRAPQSLGRHSGPQRRSSSFRCQDHSSNHQLVTRGRCGGLSRAVDQPALLEWLCARGLGVGVRACLVAWAPRRIAG